MAMGEVNKTGKQPKLDLPKKGKRPVFVVSDREDMLVEEIQVLFDWFPGMSLDQRRKNIESLHKKFLQIHPGKRILEISTSSPEEIGRATSSFKLKMLYEGQQKPIEVIYQASKVFRNGEQFLDLLDKSPLEAKKDKRLRESELDHFNYLGEKWELVPKDSPQHMDPLIVTRFYNWLYINALDQNKKLAQRLVGFDAFTDIMFNPKKSYSCSARAVALYVALYRKKVLKKALKSRKDYEEIIFEYFRVRTESKSN